MVAKPILIITGTLPVGAGKDAATVLCMENFSTQASCHFDVDPKMSEPGRLICDQLLSQTREP